MLTIKGHLVGNLNKTHIDLCVIIQHNLLGTHWRAWYNRSIRRWEPIQGEVVANFVIANLCRDSRDLSTFKLKCPKEHLGSRFVQLVLKAYRSRIGHGRKYDKGVRIPPKERLPLVFDIMRKVYTAIDTPLSKHLLMLLEKGDAGSLTEIIKTKINPNSATYANNSDLFLRDYLASSLVRKYEGFDVGIDTKEQAMKAWLHAEERCLSTNRRFRNGLDKETLRFLFQCRKLIQRILGACPSVADIRKNIRFGPGSTTSTPSKFCSSLDKLESDLKVSPQCYSLAYGIFDQENAFGFDPRTFTVTVASEWASVSKTALTDRPIEIPIIIDSMIQMSLGSLVRAKLKRFGLDLDHQASKNGLLAEFGSLTGKLATIDLESASDTISYELVKFLLPRGWFNLLNSCRSRAVMLDNEHTYHLQKFSAMGNGYTFELESLIFLVITLVASGYLEPRKLPLCIGVFGDDICCPSDSASDVIHWLTECGFSINADKTFTHGPFRESCGQDFYLGAPVRPFFIKKELKDVTQLFTVVNGLRRVSVRSLNYYGSDVRYRDVWLQLVSLIPEKYRIFGHSELGDTVIWASKSDNVTGYWPFYSASCWSYRKDRIIKAEQRTINYPAYRGGSLIRTWLLQKTGRISSEFQKDKAKLSKRSSSVSSCVDKLFADVATVPRVFRASSNYEPKWFTVNSETLSLTGNGCDCPPFI